MKKVRIYQIYDDVSENVISTFIAPNKIYAERAFFRFLNDEKHKDFINPDDFYLVPSTEVDIISDYEDFIEFMNSQFVDIIHGTELTGGPKDEG